MPTVLRAPSLLSCRERHASAACGSLGAGWHESLRPQTLQPAGQHRVFAGFEPQGAGDQRRSAGFLRRVEAPARRSDGDAGAIVGENPHPGTSPSGRRKPAPQLASGCRRKPAPWPSGSIACRRKPAPEGGEAQKRPAEIAEIRRWHQFRRRPMPPRGARRGLLPTSRLSLHGR